MVYSAAALPFMRSSVFHSLPAAAREQLASATRRRYYRRGQIIVRQGDPAGLVYMLESGYAKVMRSTPDGAEAPLRVLGPGALFGELTLLDSHPHAATAVAHEDTVMRVLPRDEFLEWLHTHPEAVSALICALIVQIRQLDDQVEALTLLGVPQRLGRKLLELADAYGHPTPQGQQIDIYLTQTELASMVGTSRSMVNHWLLSWEMQGVIARAGRCLVLQQPEALGPQAVDDWLDSGQEVPPQWVDLALQTPRRQMTKTVT
jgi:CRP/FNR family transcriptional regulator, cyclic AMP receptor protein